jgi:hypothetical protein
MNEQPGIDGIDGVDVIGEPTDPPPAPETDTRKVLSLKWLDPNQPVTYAPAVEIHVRIDPTNHEGRARIRSELGQAVFSMMAQLDREGTQK